MYFPGSEEDTYQEGSTHCAQKLINQNGHWHGDARFSFSKDTDLRLRYRYCSFLKCGYADNSVLPPNVVYGTRSKTVENKQTYPSGGTFPNLGSKHSLI